jgi:hypothetical protein
MANFYCGPVNRSSPVPSECCIFNRPDVDDLTETAARKRIQEVEEDDIREQEQERKAGRDSMDHWTNW